MVISCLLKSLSKDIFGSVLFLQTVKEIWSKLIRRYEQSKGVLIYQIQKQLISLSQGSDETIPLKCDNMVAIFIYVINFNCHQVAIQALFLLLLFSKVKINTHLSLAKNIQQCSPNHIDPSTTLIICLQIRSLHVRKLYSYLKWNFLHTNL